MIDEQQISENLRALSDETREGAYKALGDQDLIDLLESITNGTFKFLQKAPEGQEADYLFRVLMVLLERTAAITNALIATVSKEGDILKAAVIPSLIQSKLMEAIELHQKEAERVLQETVASLKPNA